MVSYFNLFFSVEKNGISIFPKLSYIFQMPSRVYL